MNVKYKLNLDVYKDRNYESIIVAQNDDKSRIIECKLYADSQPVALSSSVTAAFNATVDNVIVAENVPCIVADNAIKITLAKSMLQLAGMMKCELVLSENDTILTTQHFSVYVNKSVINSKSKYEPNGGMLATKDDINAAVSKAKSEAITAADSMLEEYDEANVAKLNLKADKQDVEEKIEKSSNMNFKKFSNITTVATARPLYVDGRYLYHTGNSSYAVSKIDVGIESAPTQIAKIGGHKNCYPREMSAGNGYLYVPYRDNKSATGTSFDANTDVGGYLDIIKLSDFTLVKTITYPRKPLNPNDGKGVRYFGKSHYTATYENKYLCVTLQMGGWLLYDISTTPENPQLLYEYDNREQCYIDNVGGKGYAEFQQPAFFSDGEKVYLAIAGYDRDLLNIYDISNTTVPNCVYTCNLRELYNNNLTKPYLHTLGIAVLYPYIYCTVAPYPGKAIGMTMEGVAVVNVADINNISVTLHAMPDSDRATESTGEPAPCSIALKENYLFTDNAEKGFAVWTITNPTIPTYVGNISTGTQVCSVHTTDDGRIFCGSTYKNNKINIYR